MIKQNILCNAIEFINQNGLDNKEDGLHYAVLSFTFCQYLCIKYAGIKDVSLDDVVMSAGDGYAFSYCPQNPYVFYSCFSGYRNRLLQLTGCVFDHQNNEKSPEKDWEHIVSGIDSGQLVQINGPEEGIVYGYEDAENIEDRRLYFVSKWGPNLNGIVSWNAFSKLVNHHGNGVQYFKEQKSNRRATAEDIIEEILPIIVDWQENHPGQNEYFGLKALKQFIADLSNPSLSSDYNDEYDCHPFFYQEAARYWQGQFFISLAGKIDNPAIKEKLAQAGLAYDQASEEMRKFRLNNIWEDWGNQSRKGKVIGYLQEAYDQEKLIINNIKNFAFIL